MSDRASPRILPEQQAAFCEYFLRQAVPRVRIGMGAAALIFTLATFADIRALPSEVLAWSVPVRLLVACPALLGLAWLVSKPERYRWHRGVAIAVCALSGSVVSGIVIHLQLIGHAWDMQRACLVTFGIYVLSGLRPSDALGIGLLMMGIVASVQVQLGYVDALLIRGSISLVGANLLGAAAAFALERAAQESFLSRVELRDMAERDGLTGLFNRRHLDDHLSRMHRQAVRDKVSLAIVMIDVDHFKGFNDTEGHLAGDECLRAVAGALGSCAQRPLDLVARYGGEEFCAVWYGVAPGAALELAERCRRSVAALEIPHPDSSAGAHVSVSCGITVAEAQDHSVDEILEAADTALFAAKDRGRNRTVMESLSKT